MRDGELCRIPVFFCQADQVSRQRCRPRNRVAHQAGIPCNALGGEAVLRPLELVRKLLCPNGALLDTYRPKAMDRDQRYGESKRQLQLTLLALMARRQLSQLIERAPQMTDRLVMSRSVCAARAGTRPKLDREIDQACL